MNLRAAQFLLAGALLGTLCACGPRTEPTGTTAAVPAPATGFDERPHLRADRDPFVSGSCRECHQSEWEAWHDSHHAKANRLLDPALDDPAFIRAEYRAHAGQNASFRKEDDRYVINTTNAQGEREDFFPDMVLAYTPLVQYLIPFPDGGWQVTQIAWDPKRNIWFDVYEDSRLPGEWGFWTGRGMNWNSQCAFCHTTGFEKNYDPASNTYASQWIEQGVGCVQCHGPMTGHAEAARKPGYRKSDGFNSEQILHNCAGCHSRRDEITGTFAPGQRYDDHFVLQTAHEERLYYPDGQIRDEVYVYGSFLMSGMHAAGVRCLDCHDPHSARLKLPWQNNAICQQCHGEQPQRGAPRIDPTAHSFHPAGSTGNRCVECHMHETVYMQNDPRRDHGFHTPDPLLTRELGIPNACNRCHEDKDTAWAEKWVDQWYGTRMDRPARARTRALAAAQRGEPEAWKALLENLNAEKIPFWQANLIMALAPAASVPEVTEALDGRLSSPFPVVRSAAIRALRGLPQARERVRPLLEDESGLVRHEAARTFEDAFDPSITAFREYERYVTFHADQPSGAALMGRLEFYRENPEEAMVWMNRAVEYDPNSLPIYGDAAIMLHALGRFDEAVEWLEEASRRDPQNPEYPFSQALVRAEQGNLPAAIGHLEETVRRDPSFDRAWYNLGLARAQTGSLDESIECLLRAESLRPRQPAYAYARATILVQLGRIDEARAAAARALETDPNFAPAARLLQQLGNR